MGIAINPPFRLQDQQDVTAPTGAEDGQFLVWDDAGGAFTWQAVSADFLPLAGGTMTGTAVLAAGEVWNAVSPAANTFGVWVGTYGGLQTMKIGQRDGLTYGGATYPEVRFLNNGTSSYVETSELVVKGLAALTAVRANVRYGSVAPTFEAWTNGLDGNPAFATFGSTFKANMDGSILSTPTSAAVVPLTLTLAAGSTANPILIKNSVGSTLFRVGWDGTIWSNQMYAPAANYLLQLSGGGTYTMRDGLSQIMVTHVHNAGGTLRNAGTTRIEWDATGIGLFGATPAAQPAHVADPVGGTTVDAEARTAINAINAAMATLGLTAAS